MRAILLPAVLSLTLTGAACSQEPSKSDGSNAKAVSFDELMAMVKQGKDAPAILDSCDTIFTLSADERDKLLKAGASLALIDALQRKRMNLGDVRNIVVILDCSGSMGDQMPDGKTKMDAAKKVVTDVIESIPAGRNLCLILYGHDAALRCEAVKVVRELGPLKATDRSALKWFVGGLRPIGHTPIAKSLRTAGDALAKAEGLCQIVLITDGEETCNGDPAKEAEKLALRENVRAIEVIGLGLSDKEKEGVKKIAHGGRGRFYDAQNAKDLGAALAKAADVPQVPPVAVEPKRPKVERPDPMGAFKLEDGFKLLFNGKDFAGWEVEGGDPKGWSVEKGELVCRTHGDASRNWLITKAEHKDFILRFDFKLTKGANGGVAFRYRPGDEKVFRAEVQILDDRNPGGDSAPKRRTGSLYDLAADRPADLKPLDEWNSMEVKLQGRNLTVKVNGRETVAAHLDRFIDKADKIRGLSRDSGRIGLQNWNASIRFRNIRIKELNADEPVATKQEPLPADLSPAAKSLIEALSDEDLEVRLAAAKGLARFKHSAVVAALSRLLDDKEPRLRRAAADSLGEIGDRACANALVKRIADEVWVPLPAKGVRYDPENPPAIDGEKGWGSKAHALAAIKRVVPERVVPALVQALKAKTVEVRRWAAVELGNEKGEEAVAALAAALADSDGRVQRRAADSLGKIGKGVAAAADALAKRVADSTWVPAPKESFQYPPDDPPAFDGHENWGAKQHALQALRNVAPTRVEEALTAALISKNPEIRKWAVKELAQEKGKQ